MIGLFCEPIKVVEHRLLLTLQFGTNRMRCARKNAQVVFKHEETQPIFALVFDDNPGFGDVKPV